MAEPIKPEGVCLVLADGTEVPLEVEYIGFGLFPADDGVYDALHVWDVVLEVPIGPGRSRVKIASMPPQTTLRFPADIAGIVSLA
jgi:hypothetical protein